MGFETSSLWLRTLGQNDGPNTEQVQRLKAAYLQFREHVRPLADDIALSVPGYTEHGIAHCDSLWDAASKLIDDRFPINPAEAFVLGGAFLIHDLGMGASAYAGGLKAVVSSQEFMDLAAEAFPDDFVEICDGAVQDLSKNETWDGLTDLRVKELLTNLLRQRHASQAGEILQTSWTLTNKESYYLLADTTLRAFYAESIGQIAQSHWTEVSKLPDELPAYLGPLPEFPSDWDVDPIKLACLLRLADAINLDASRAHPLHTPHRSPQAESLLHWQSQERLLGATVKDRRVYFTSANGFSADLVDAWWLTYEAIRMIDGELRNVDNLCADLELPRFLAHAVAGAESPARFAKFVRPRDWEPVDASPFIGNQESVMKQLGGAALYGKSEQDEVALREILANALDATRAYRRAYDGVTPRPIEVSLVREENHDRLVIRDYGVGILSAEIASTLCNFGTSSWRGESARKILPGLVSSGYTPTGKFGIGFFACFMSANSVTVTSRHIEEAKPATTRLIFNNGLDSRPVVMPVQRRDQFLEPGTSVELLLKRRVDTDGGLLWTDAVGVELSGDTFARYIRCLALTSDETIVTRVNNEATLVAVEGNQWLTSDGETLFDAMNPFVDYANERYVSARTEFSEFLEPLLGPEGNVVARLTARSSRGPGSSGMWLDHFRAYCGGLLARETFVPFAGIAEGKPASAARRSVEIGVEAAEVQRWFKAQLELLSQREISDDLKRSFRSIAIRVDVGASDLPVAFTKGGAVADCELGKWIADREYLAILEGDRAEFRTENESIPLMHGLANEPIAIMDENVLLLDGQYYSRLGTWGRTNELASLPEAQKKEHAEVLRWWSVVHARPLGEVARLIAGAWQLELLAVLYAFTYASANEETELDALKFTGLNKKSVQISGWYISRRDAEFNQKDLELV